MGQSRNENALENILGAENELLEPVSRNEKILHAILGEEIELEPPQSRIEELLLQINEQGSLVTIEPLEVSENGTYEAAAGKAFNPVAVSVPQTTVEALSVTANGTYTAEAGKAYSPVNVNVPVPTIQALTATANGVYSETGKAYSPVTVNVTADVSVLSPKATKNLARITPLIGEGSATTAVTVKSTSELTGGDAGVPTDDAYSAAITARWQGAVIPVTDMDWRIPSQQNLQGWAVDFWLWLSDASKCKLLVARFFEYGKRDGLLNWDYQWNPQFDGSVTLKNGWNHLVMRFPRAGADFDRRPNGIGAEQNPILGDGSEIVEMAVTDYAADSTYEMAVAAATLIKL